MNLPYLTGNRQVRKNRGIFYLSRMNKARRHELKMLHYKRRLRKLRLIPGVHGSLYQYRSHGQPCNCDLCQRPDLKYNRAKEKLQINEGIADYNDFRSWVDDEYGVGVSRIFGYPPI